ncbi:MAG: hydantoinase B/oxoprolinase family protein [Lautropia sp.]
MTMRTESQAGRAGAGGQMDPVTIEVLWTRLISLVDEAALSLHRTSFSTVVRESHDYTCMVLDPSGRAVAQASRSVPSFIGTLPMSVRAFLQQYPADRLDPGDVIISNDPWIGTGHLPDITIAAPLFFMGRLVGFGGAIAHMPDIGGRRRAPDARDLYEEGLQIPILKLYERGQPNRTLFDIITRNVRVPDEVLGDLHAMVGATSRIQHSLEELMREYRMPDLAELTDEIVGRTERAMREAILAVPDGNYRATTMIDSFSTEKPLTMQCAITIDGSNLHVDYAGSSPQNPSPLNSVLGYTRAYSTYALKCILLPDVPNNEGNVLPIRIDAPEGSFLNPRYPAAVEARSTVGHYTTSAVLNALALALPDRVPAEAGIPVHGLTVSGRTADRSFSGIFFYNGGFGARPGQDGISTLSFPTNVSNTPTEILERKFPLRVIEKSLRAGSGGAGQYRGGLGQRIVLQVVNPEGMDAVLLSQRLRFAPRGRSGGRDGAVERLLLNGQPIEGSRPFRLSQGDVMVLELPGGGGFGPPEQRAEQASRRDRDWGYV